MVEIPMSPERENGAEVRFCLVRHGETEWNSARRIQGQTDIGLNSIGERQARAAGRWLRQFPVSALYASDLQRALLTARLIGAAIGQEAVSLSALRERQYGQFEGLTYEEAHVRYPAIYARFEARDPDENFVSGESLKALYARVTGALQQLAQQHVGQTLVVVVHGGVLDIINRFVRGNPLEMPRDFLIPNAGLNWISHRDGAWRLLAWGETPHLSAGALDELPA